MDKQALSELAAGAVNALSANLNIGGANETPLSRWISSRLSATVIAAIRKSPTEQSLRESAEQELVALLRAQPALISQLAGLMQLSHNGIVMPQDGKR
jgi:hypothetical protein